MFHVSMGWEGGWGWGRVVFRWGWGFIFKREGAPWGALVLVEGGLEKNRKMGAPHLPLQETLILGGNFGI